MFDPNDTNLHYSKYCFWSVVNYKPRKSTRRKVENEASNDTQRYKDRQLESRRMRPVPIHNHRMYIPLTMLTSNRFLTCSFHSIFVLQKDNFETKKGNSTPTSFQSALLVMAATICTSIKLLFPKEYSTLPREKSRPTFPSGDS